jgi:ribosomal-protein-alanine N-acetyltransferase
MNENDIDGVMAVEVLAFKTPWTRTAFEEEICNNDIALYLVLLETNSGSEKIIGYAGMWKVIDEAHVTNIAILPAYHRQGFGHILFTALINQAKDMGAVSMTLEVRESNTAARRFYENFGFKEEGVRGGYYSDTNEDALIMWKNPL